MGRTMERNSAMQPDALYNRHANFPTTLTNPLGQATKGSLRESSLCLLSFNQ